MDEGPTKLFQSANKSLGMLFDIFSAAERPRASFDKIKIDRSFVHDLLSKHDSRAIIQALVQLASSLGLNTTAEGVETQGELDYLKRVGCTEAQGYFFSKAVPPKQVFELLNPGLRAETSVA